MNGFSKDTNPGAIARWRQTQSMSRDQAIQSLREAHAEVGSLLTGWWRRLCRANNVDPADPNFTEPLGMGIPSLNDAIAEFDRTFRRIRVELAVFFLRKKLGWAKLGPYKCVLAPLCDHLEAKFPRPTPEIPPAVLGVIPVEVAQAINAMSQYTAMNAGQFQNVPPAQLLKQLLNQVWAAGQDEARKESIGKAMPYAQISGRCDRPKLDAVLKVVKEGRGAVCTSFAASAASLLVSGLGRRAYRVEMISGPNHCFCLVNRAPAPEGVEKPGPAGATLFPAVSYWGPDAIIVDAWAGALGHPVFYYPADTFPQVLKIYLTQRLLQHYDSQKDGV